MKKVRSNQLWLIIWSIILILGTTVPYFFGFLNARNSAYQFSGFIFGVEDGNSYIAKMLLGWSGDWLFRTPYTAFPQKGFLAFLPYILLGKLASFEELHLQLVMIFQIFRMVGILFLVFEIYKFVKIFVQSEIVTRLAVLLSCFGGGLGWLLIILKGNIPLEFYSPEAFGFLSLMGLPHLLFARAFMFRALRMLLQPGIDVLNIDRKITSGVYLFLAGLFQPLIIPQTWLIFGVWKLAEVIFLRKEKWMQIIRSSVYLFFIPLPFFLYNAFNFLFDPYLSAWQDQNIIKSPPPLDFIWAYGIGFICVIFVLLKNAQSVDKKEFLYSWIILFPVLVYMPINLQRRLSEGFWVILVIFIAIVLSKVKKRIWLIIMMVTMSLSSIFLYAGAFIQLKDINYPIYQPNLMLDIFKNIDYQRNEKLVVLAPYDVSNVLPAYLSLKVITGHGPESKNLKEVQHFVTSFFANSVDNDVREFFSSFPIEYIIFPRSLKVDAPSWWSDNAELIYENDGYLLYKMIGMDRP